MGIKRGSESFASERRTRDSGDVDSEEGGVVISGDKTGNDNMAVAGEVEGGRLVCRLKLNGEEVVVAGGTTRKNAETRAANIAVK
ncbi:hypothetical protein MMC10_003848 [Thelotrema lepadinum]|nr:hypothetical protein [Thelotrema lepadinum]